MNVPPVPGFLSITAVALYVATSVLCANSLRNIAAMPREIRLPNYHARIWLFAMVLFLALAVSRWFGIEESVRILLRGTLRADGLYQERREFQAVIASIAITIAALGGMWGFALLLRSRVLQRRGPSRIVASAGVACATLVLLVALRLVSFHAIDMILYRGPRLNWFIDIGATVFVAGAAIRYVLVLAKIPRQRR